MNHPIIITKGDITMRQGQNREVLIFKGGKLVMRIVNPSMRLTNRTFENYYELYEDYGMDGNYVRIQNG